MNNLETLSTSQIAARQQLVSLVSDVLNQTASFFEAAGTILSLRDKVGGVNQFDPDFLVFTSIYSQSDHLPQQSNRHLWSSDALAAMDVELQEIETWAASFATVNCKNLLARFKT